MLHGDGSSLLDVGDVAPDFALAPGGGDRPSHLSGLRGGTVLLLLLPPHWDPACDELASMYGGERPGDAPLVVLEQRATVARLFGVRDTTALFAIDEQGVIRWRYVAGVDPLPLQPAGDEHARFPSDDRPSTMSRRDFVRAAMVAAAVLAAAVATRPLHAAVRSFDPALAAPLPGARIVPVALTVNGRPITVNVEPRVTLLDALREYAGLTGTKKGCDHGQCGACTVHVDGRRVLSCMTLAVMQQGTHITTIEGLASGDTLHPMQQAFITHDGFQCGYCTSGQIMSATAMVAEPWGPADDDVREAMSGNICRCGAYPGIVAAVQAVRTTRAETAR